MYLVLILGRGIIILILVWERILGELMLDCLRMGGVFRVLEEMIIVLWVLIVWVGE